jgi:hypothetical protein
MKRFSLGPVETGKTVKIIRVIFGVLCITVAAYWVIFNIRAEVSIWSLWITSAFLTGFGLYQIWAGFGHAERFITIDDRNVVLKSNSFFPAINLNSDNLEGVEFYPMSLIFRMKNGRKKILRFGTLFADNIEPVKDAIEEFAAKINIRTETISEEIL